MSDYMAKIRNLLDLSESPNEHEARSALLKARELMAKHKILEKDLENNTGQDVERVMTDVDYSARRDPWIADLAVIIAGHHCCNCVQNRMKGFQTAVIGFIGLRDDVAVCADVFKYAAGCVRLVTDGYRKARNARAADGYGYGFASGLSEAYRKQDEAGFGLVLVVPDAVNKAMDGMRKKTMSAGRLQASDARAFRKGSIDGYEFGKTKRIGGFV